MRPLAALVLAVAVVAGPLAGSATATGPATTPEGSASTAAAAPYTLDLAEARDWVAQTNFVQCVGASMQMMANIVEPGADRTAGTQLDLQQLARRLSGPSNFGRERQGASIRGWVAGLNHLGYGPYRIVGDASLQDALRSAARAMRATGRPVGLLVWRGRHAWVMSGFRATADPATTDRFEVTAVRILDPLYPHGSATWGASPSPKGWTSVEAVGRQFVARSTSSSGRWLTLGLAGKWVLALPASPLPAPVATRIS
jgi:hypothetical protein